jgi:hypothetical protein
MGAGGGTAKKPLDAARKHAAPDGGSWEWKGVSRQTHEHPSLALKIAFHRALPRILSGIHSAICAAIMVTRVQVGAPFLSGNDFPLSLVHFSCYSLLSHDSH